MKHRFSSMGKPYEIPLVHSPAFQKSQGLAQELMVLDTRAAVSDGGGGSAAADGALGPAVAAAALAAAALFSFSLSCT